MKIKKILLIILSFVLVLTFISCSKNQSNKTNTLNESQELSKNDSTSEPTSSVAFTTYTGTFDFQFMLGTSDDKAGVVPSLPQTGSSLKDFACKDWKLLDSVKFDYNSDGKKDYVGVLQQVGVRGMGGDATVNGYWYPRILFAIKSTGINRYSLDFQDCNLIKTNDEGGIFGDPYMPLTYQKNSFTIHDYGGSAWRWGDDDTYSYIEGQWYLTHTYHYYGNGPVITQESTNDYLTGIGIRKYNSSDFDSIVKIKEGTFALTYNIKLDEPPTIKQYSSKNIGGRISKITANRVIVTNDINITLSELNNISNSDIFYADEKYLAIGFTTENKRYYSLYNISSRVMTILTEANNINDSFEPFIYNNEFFYIKNYYDSSDDTIIIDSKLMSVDLNGSHNRTIFDYKNDISKNNFVSLTPEITGNEIILEIYKDSTSSFYRMNLDGSNQKFIGDVNH